MSLDGCVAPPDISRRRAPFKQAGDGRVELERTRLAQSGGLTDLRFGVRDDGGK
jgi:hypothetical protein